MTVPDTGRAGYPLAERVEGVELLHRHAVADPYRWLADPSDEHSVTWAAGQDELARVHLDELPLDRCRYSSVNDEYGTAEDPIELSWLPSHSRSHHGTPRVAYPAVLVTVFDSDRRETDVGRGARAVSRTVALATDQLAFLAAHPGLELR